MAKYDKDHPYRWYDMRRAARQLTREQGMDPGEYLEDSTTCIPPTLDAMSTGRGEHPGIGDVGSPPMPRYSGGSKNSPGRGEGG